MAYFAKLSDQNKVLQVLAVDNSIVGEPENESLGRAHLETIHGWPANMWKQCSYNTYNGKYFEQDENNERVEAADQSKALRGNYPGVGYIYDTANDKFYESQPHASWILNQTKWSWEPPVVCPDPTKPYEWNEDTQDWDGPFTVENDPYA